MAFMVKGTLFQMRNCKKVQSQEPSVLLGCSGTGGVSHGMAKYLGISVTVVGYAVEKGEAIARDNSYHLIDLLSFLRPSCFSAFYYSSLNLLSLFLGQG